MAGDIAAQVDQQKASGNTGNKIQLLSLLFILVLLVLIFRSLTLALVTVIPPLLSFTIAGPLVAEAAQHGLQVSPIAEFLMIVLVLGAGTDYGLFLVFRVREALRAGQHATAGEYYPGARGLGGSLLGDFLHPRAPAREAIVGSVTKVGESITFSAATVIAAMLTLLLASFSFYADLGGPFAIAIGVTLIAALTLLPALLSIRLSLLAAKRSLFRAMFKRPKLLPWNIQGSGKAGIWGRVAGPHREAPDPDPGVRDRGVRRAGVRGVRLHGGRFRREHRPARRHRLRRRAGAAHQVLPAVLGQPDHGDLPCSSTPVWQNPAPLATATSKLQATGLFTQVAGPLNPGGATLTPAQFTALHSQARPGQAAAARAAGRQHGAGRRVRRLPGHGQLRQP